MMFSSKAKRQERTVHSKAAQAKARRQQPQRVIVKLLNDQQRLRGFVERMNDRHE